MTVDVRVDSGAVPLLADGTSLSELIDLEGRRLKARLLQDPEVFELEMRKLFTKTWVFVAHESELPAPNDFVMRYIGTDPVVVTRDAGGALHVLLNVCSHRGGHVCRADPGTETDFRCPYHGWVYELDGALVAVPGERDAYGPSFDKGCLGLAEARVETYEGLIFANWDQDAPPLDEFLGDFTFYLDMLFKLTDWVVAGPPQRWIVKANWKFGADNFAGDGYHSSFVHRSIEDMMVELSGEGAGMLWASNWGVNVCDPATGHGTRCLPGTFAITEEELAASGLNDQQQELVRANVFPVVGTVFPNLSFLILGRPQDSADEIPDPFVSIRLWAPHGPDSMVVWNWALVEPSASEEIKARSRAATLRGFGTSGTLEQDDAEAWSQIQRMFTGAKGRERDLIYASTSPHRAEDWREGRPWPGPGEVHQGFTTEDNQWNWWRQWHAHLTR